MDASPTEWDSRVVRETPRTQPEFIRLDRRVISLWRIRCAAGWAVVLGFGLIGTLLVSTAVTGTMTAGLVGWCGLVILVGATCWWYAKRAYAAWGYRVDDRVLETRSGVWFHVLHLLPLSRLQHVDLRRGPLERTWGLASLVLHTAGTHEAALVIPGLEAEEAVRLRDQLVVGGGDDAV